jgi:hypothetical protein
LTGEAAFVLREQLFFRGVGSHLRARVSGQSSSGSSRCALFVAACRLWSFRRVSCVCGPRESEGGGTAKTGVSG